MADSETYAMNDPAYEPTPPESSWRAYHRITRTATYGFLLALPLLALYESVILIVNRGEVMQVRISAEVWLKQILPSLGTAGWHILAAVVLVIGIGVFVAERKKHIPIRPRYFGAIVAESMLYAIVLAFFVSAVVGIIFAAAPVSLIAAQVAGQSIGTQLALSIGAGIYEELLFRVLLVGGMYVAFKKILPQKMYAYLIAAVIGALLFSTVHYIGALGDEFTLASFTFRFLFGLALNGVFLARGFGVAAWTHALYDVMIVTGLLG